MEYEMNGHMINLTREFRTVVQNLSENHPLYGVIEFKADPSFQEKEKIYVLKSRSLKSKFYDTENDSYKKDAIKGVIFQVLLEIEQEIEGIENDGYITGRYFIHGLTGLTGSLIKENEYGLRIRYCIEKDVTEVDTTVNMNSGETDISKPAWAQSADKAKDVLNDLLNEVPVGRADAVKIKLEQTEYENMREVQEIEESLKKYQIKDNSEIKELCSGNRTIILVEYNNKVLVLYPVNESEAVNLISYLEDCGIRWNVFDLKYRNVKVEKKLVDIPSGPQFREKELIRG